MILSVSNSKLAVYPRHFIKNLSHMVKDLQACKFSQNCLLGHVKKHDFWPNLGEKFCLFFNKFYIFKPETQS